MKSIARGAIIGTCALAVLCTAGTAEAQRRARVNRDAPVPRIERLAEALELTDEQMDQLKSLREAGLEEMADLRKEMLRVRHDMRGEMLEDNPDIAKLKKLIATKSEIRANMEIFRLEHRMAMRDILTEEQRDKLMMLRGRGWRGGFRDGCGFGRGKMGFRRGMRGGGRGFGPGMGFGDGPGFGGRGPCGQGFGMGLCPLDMEFDGLGPGPLWDDED